MFHSILSEMKHPRLMRTRILPANAVSVFVAWQARVGSYVFIRLINIATLTLRQCHGTKKIHLFPLS